jgi:branched-chain amino acid transport system ATP-binding protein
MDIVFDCNIGVNKGEIACIVGPNGAGKSTVMKSLFGLIGIRKGKVLLDGEDITNMLPQERVLKGMGFVPQTNNIFPSLSVQENLEMGAFIENNDPKDMLDYIYGLFPILHDKQNQQAGELSGGQRQQVAVGRALMTNPKVLMLDEPSAGVSPIVMEGIFNKIQEIAKQGTAVLMVEQNAKQALEISDLGFVLNQGKNLFTNTGKSLLDNKEVRKSFLGG